jgi:hypothetical protein
MRFRHIQFLFLLPSLLLSACASTLPAHEFLPDAARDKISSTEVVVPIAQSEIYVFVPVSTSASSSVGASFGLLGAIVGTAIDAGINDARTTKAEAAVKPLRDALVDFKFDETFQSDVKNSISSVPWMHVDNVRVVKQVTNGSLDQVLTDSKAGAVLFAATDYHLSNAADILSITVAVSLFPNNDTLRALKANSKIKGDFKSAVANALYHNTMAYETKAPDSTGDRDHNMANWSANGGAAMRASLTSGMEKLAAMLADDLQRQQTGPAAGPDVSAPAKLTIEGVTGDIIATDTGGTLVRFADGTLKYVTK